MAGTTTSFVFHYRGRFTDINQRHRLCCICIYNRLRELQVGVPTLTVGTIFTTLPWLQSGIFCTDFESTHDWLFFATPPTNYRTIRDIGLKWQANPKKEIQFADHQRIVLTHLYLRAISGHAVDYELMMRSKKWVLNLYECGEFSLYCLVVVREDKNLLTVLFPDGCDGRAFTLKAETLDDLYEWKAALEQALAQAPNAALVIGQNGIFRTEANNTIEASFNSWRDQRPLKSSVIGRPILQALEETD
ncbi:unnamed protein product [Arabidopsis arenosa]|uniref:PH domain-containing protein n=1 Tax=Arabidopsis arenosa TaxID=38785 RepID=A0A8S2AJU4_ARAAE|nr:unnamed protein product [Arabidopsis arenosa]